jgi:glyoxylase-like metal-dependent hydrolase (beta-lactamase superfamily II)
MKTGSAVSQVTDGIYKFSIPTPFAVGEVNVYVVEGEKLTLFDAGYYTDETVRQLEREMNAAGFSLNDIEQVILTHHHVDHVGLLGYFSAHHPVPVYGHVLCNPWLAHDEEFFADQMRSFGAFYLQHGAPKALAASPERLQGMIRRYTTRAPLTETLDEGDALPGLPGWQVLYTPGHAQSHLCFYRPKDRVMIAGDHLIAHISPNALVEPPTMGTGERPKTLIQYRQSLQKIYDLPLSLTLSGHGSEITNHRQLIDKRFAETEDRANKIQRLLIERGSMTAYELTQAIFPKVYEKEFALTMSEIIGHLDLLQSQNRIETIETDGVLRYTA